MVWRLRKFYSYGAFIAASFALVSCGTGASWVDGVPRPAGGLDSDTKTSSVFSLPRFNVPGFNNGRGSMPAFEVQCRRELKKYNVGFKDIPTIRDSAYCGIEHPVEVSMVARGVALKPAAKLNCKTALAVAKWVQRDAGPASRARYLSGIKEIRQMSSYSCRRIRGKSQWSEHSSGNALDIGSFKLKNGRIIHVARPSFFAFREKGFLKSVRAQACGHFGTVLGPGDRDHHDHFHFDLRSRKKTYCSL